MSKEWAWQLQNEVYSAVFEEWHLKNVADGVHTFGTVVLGLTLERYCRRNNNVDPRKCRLPRSCRLTDVRGEVLREPLG